MLSRVYVKEIPEVTLISSTDWVAIGSMVVTVIIVVLAAWFQVHQAKMLAEQTKKQMEAEQDLRRRQFVAQSRCEWIENLREYTSQFITQVDSTLNVFAFSYTPKLQKILMEANKKTEDSRERMSSASFEVFVEIKELIRLKNKVELLLNSEEELAQVVLGKMAEINNFYLGMLNEQNSAIKKHANRFDGELDLSEQLKSSKIHELQTVIITTVKHILKVEWERVKKLED